MTKFYELFIALKYISANMKQSIIITTAVGIGVALIIWIPSINIAFFNDLIDKSVSNSPNITIKKELDTFESNKIVFQKKYKNKTLLLDDQVLTRKRNIKSYRDIYNQIKHIEQIEAVAPFTEGNAFIIRGGEERGVSLKGITSDLELNVVDIENDIIKGRVKNLGINDVVIGVILSKKLNVDIGQRVKVSGPTGVSKNLRIVGIFSTGLRANDEYKIYVSLKTGQQILGLNNDISGLGVKIKNIYMADKIAQQISDLTGLNVTSWMSENKQVLDQINRFRLIIVFINFLIIFSAASSITSVFIMLIASKSKEIGILKSMGAKNLSIMSIFLIQAISLSIIGYFIGLTLSKLMLIGYSSILEASGETLFSTEVPKFYINKTYATLAFFYAFVSSIFASIIPAWQAAKLNPVEAING